MSLLPDPQVLRAIATRIGLQAEATRARARALDAALSGVTWHGQAASTFQTMARPLGGALRMSATDLDRAASALRSHADAVEALLADLRREGVDLVHGSTDLVHLLRDGADPTTLLAHPGRLLHDEVHLAKDGVALVGDGARLSGDVVGGAMDGLRHGAKALISTVGL